MSWEKVRLGDVTDSCLGKMLDQHKNKGDFHPYLANINVRWGNFELDNLPQMRFEDSENERYGIQYGDLIVCEGGEPGRCAIWKEQIPNMKIQKALHRIRVHDCLDYRYLYYWFLWAGKRGELEQYFTGSTIKHMPGEKLKSIVIDMPPLNTQRYIASILSAYDDLIENNQKQIKLLEEAAQRLYKEWFVDLRFPGWENTKIVDGVPEGWISRKISNLGNVITGKTPSTQNSSFYGKDIPFITIPDMHNFVFPLYTEKKLSNEGANSQPTKYIPAGSLLISCIATVGLTCISCAHCQTNQQINSIIPFQKKYLYYLYEFFSSKKEYLNNIGSSGATMNNVNKSKIENIPVLLPSDNLLNSFHSNVQSIMDKILILQNQFYSLKSMQDTTIKKIFYRGD